jgi:hypothetical protein
MAHSSFAIDGGAAQGRESSRPPRGKARLFALIVPGLLLAACADATPAQSRAANASVDAAVPIPSPPANLPVTHVDATDDAETARIQAYLDQRYKPSDVVHSFRSKFGEDIDCIDFLAQPSVRARIAHGEHVEIPVVPELPTSAETRKVAQAIGFMGEPDENGQARRCPGTTVPFIRKTVTEVKAAGGLAAYLKRRQHAPEHPPVSGAVSPPDVGGFFHVIAKYPITGSSPPSCGTGGSCRNIRDNETPPCPSGQPTCPPAPIQGGSAIFSVHNPQSDPEGHSLAQTWTFSGNNVSDLTGCHQCTTDCTQSVEMGWMVSPLMFNDSNTHVFVYSTQDGYWNTGAYANDPGPAPNCDCIGLQEGNCGACFNSVEDPFVGVPAAKGQPQFAPGMQISKADGLVNPSQNPVVVDGGIETFTPSEITFGTVNNMDGKGWFVSINNVIFGQYPASAFATSSLPANGSLANTATVFWAGGEVAGPSGTAFNANTPTIGWMGSGYGAIGYKWSAYIRNFEYLVPTSTSGLTTESSAIFSLEETNPNCYSVGFGFDGIPATGSPNPGASNWGNYLYYGGLGHQCGGNWDLFPGGCDACCTFAPSNIETNGSCPSTLTSSQACDSYCNQPPPAGGESPFEQLTAECEE